MGGKRRPEACRHIIKTGLAAGLAAAGVLGGATLLNRKRTVSALTTDPTVRAACVSLLPLVVLCQVLKGVAYPVNGALMGGLDWGCSGSELRRKVGSTPCSMVRRSLGLRFCSAAFRL